MELRKVKKVIKGSVLGIILATSAAIFLKESNTINYENCTYEINYPDGNGGTIKKLSNAYAESYFINGVHQHKYFFIPLSEIDTIFFVGDNEKWNMKRLSCD